MLRKKPPAKRRVSRVTQKSVRSTRTNSKVGTKLTKTYCSGLISFRYVSDESLAGYSLESLLIECDMGCAVGRISERTEKSISKDDAKKLLLEYGSNENFFGSD